MAESVRTAIQALPALGIDPALLDHLPTTGTTLHRLLSTIPDSPRFRHHADNPLPFDVVVVDEASMIDLPLMAKLVEAVPDGARLRSEEHTSELQSLMRISYAVFCLQKKTKIQEATNSKHN